MTRIGRIGIIGGGGWLGSAIATSLLRSELVSADHLVCSYRSTSHEGKIRCHWTKDNVELVERSDVVILCVRPADWRALNMSAADQLVISVMAGVALADIRHRTGARRVARALPNAAAEVGFSYTPIYVESNEEQDSALVRMIFESCGEVDVVSSEDHIDYFTAMSGSGAAFPALLAQAMMNDAIARGIPAAIANHAVQQILIGTGRLQEAHRSSPADTVKAFVDYNGTTAAGIIKMRETGIEAIVHAGLEAAYRKALSLSRE